MTRRERLEAKLKRREEWAAKANQRSAARFDAVSQIADSIPLGQPILVSHHSERHARRDAERIRNGMTKGIEEADLAKHHASKADGLAHQLDRSIFSDAPDAVEALEAKVASLEAKRDAMKTANAAVKLPLCNYRAADGVTALNKFHGTTDMHLSQVEMTKAEYTSLHKDYKGTQIVTGSHRVRSAMVRHTLVYVYLTDAPETPPPPPASTTGAKPYAAWEITNLGARIRQAKERIAEVQARQKRQEAAEDAGGVVIVEHAENNWCSVTFAEKPDREILDALRAAGYGWGSGRWNGRLDRLPEVVREVAEVAKSRPISAR